MAYITHQQLKDHLSVFEPGFPLHKGYVAQLLFQHSVPDVVKKVKAIVTAAEPNKNLQEGTLYSRLRIFKQFISNKRCGLFTEWPTHIELLLEPFHITFRYPNLSPALKSTPLAASSSENPEQTSTQTPVKLKHFSQTPDSLINPDLPQTLDTEIHSDLPQTPHSDLPQTPDTEIHSDFPQTPDSLIHPDLTQTLDTLIHTDLPQTPDTEIHSDLPQTPHSDLPQTPHSDLPQTPHSDLPQTPHSDLPQTPHSDLPQTPHSDLPQTPHSDLPQTPHSDLPQTPHSDLPQTPQSDLPQTPHPDLPQTPHPDLPQTPHADFPQTPDTLIQSDNLQTSTPTHTSPPISWQPCSATCSSQSPITVKQCCPSCATKQRAQITLLQKNERLNHKLKDLKTLFGAESENLLLKRLNEKIRRKAESVMIWRNKYITLKASNDTRKLLDSVYSLEQKVKTLEENLIAAQEESLNMTSVIEQLKSMHEKTENYDAHLKYISSNSPSHAYTHTDVEENGTIVYNSHSSVCHREGVLSDSASKYQIINTKNMVEDVSYTQDMRSEEEMNTITPTEAAESVIITDYQLVAGIKKNSNNKCIKDLQQGRSSKLLEQGLPACQNTTRKNVANIVTSSMPSLEEILASQTSCQPSVLHAGKHHTIGNKCDSPGLTFKENVFQKRRRTHANFKLYKCDVCGHQFAKDSFLKIHKKMHIGDKPYKSDICGRGISAKANLRVHSGTHAGEKPYRCDVCGLMFSGSGNLDVHKQSHLDVSSASPSHNAYTQTDIEENGTVVYNSQSSVCHRQGVLSDKVSHDIIINTKNMVEDVSCTQHVRSQEEKNTHTHTEAAKSVTVMDFQVMMAGIENNHDDECSEDLQQGRSSKLLEQGLSDCQKTTQQDIANIISSIKSLEEILASKKSCQPSVLHAGKHHTIGNKCDSSGRKFKENIFQKHRLTHAKYKPYRCDVCGHRFAKDSLLKIHKRTHAEDKPYRCCLPRRGFSVKENMRMHTRAHRGEESYKCDVCGLTFSGSGELDVHKQSHTGERPYQCDFCGLSFTEKCSLEMHTRTHNSITQLKCNVCGLEFEEKADLRKHKKVHKGEKNCVCNICGQRFKRKCDLTLHNRKHTGEKPYHCDVCGKSFAHKNVFKRHIRIHTDERPYKCDVCGFAFRTSSSLSAHKLIHTGEKPYMCDICGFQVNRKGNLRLHKRVHQKNT